MIRYKFLPGFSVLCLLPFFAIGQVSLSQKIDRAWRQFAGDPQLKYGSFSLTVLNGTTGEPLFAVNENQGLATASTLKTITSATAFYLLGAGFTYQTLLGYSGSISADGVLNGDLIITGAGDPTLGSWRYEKTREQIVLNNWVAAVKQAGIRKISGRVLVDDRLFGTQTLPAGWIWQDIGNYYGAGPASLTWRENQFDLTFRPGSKPGEPATLVRTAPKPPLVTIQNEVTTGPAGSGDEVYVFSAPYSSVIYLRGTYGIDLKKTISASVPDPALEAASRLRDTLVKVGISAAQVTTARIEALERRSVPVPVQTLYTHTSPDLSQIIYWFNQKSVNLYGEHLVRTIALQSGKEPTTPNGAEVIRDFWKQKLGIDKNSLNMIDGSGLSPGTRVTTLTMSKILFSVKKEPWFGDYFKSLPVYNDMKMKSGSINDVLAYAGYHTGSSGTPVVFSLIVNNYNGSSSAIRQKMFTLLNALK